MSSLPNAHAALLRNLELLRGQVLFIGLSDAAVLAQVPHSGQVLTDHYGVYQQLAGHPVWQPVYGYFGDETPLAAADTVVVFMPKAKAELALRLQAAAALVAPAGSLVLIGEKREGVASAVKQLQAISSQAYKVDSARHCQVWQGTPDAPGQPLKMEDWLEWHTVEVAGVSVEVAGLPGIFSAGRLDEGTRMLLDTLAAQPVRGPVLDFACGAGVIGAWLQANQPGDGLRVDGVDVQAQAVLCARETYRRAGAEGHIEPGDGLAEVSGRYQTIVTNPPFHSGVRTDTSMTTRFLQQVAKHLKSGGELRLVANSFLPYQEQIDRHIGPSEVLARDNRFTVYRAKRH